MLSKLGLATPVPPVFGFALLPSSPLLIGFAPTRGVDPHFSTPDLLFLTALSPFVEELKFFLSWLLSKWENLWLPITLHVCKNLAPSNAGDLNEERFLLGSKANCVNTVNTP